MPCLAGVQLADPFGQRGYLPLKRTQKSDEPVRFVIIDMPDDDRPEMYRTFHNSAVKQFIGRERAGQQLIHGRFDSDVPFPVGQHDGHIQRELRHDLPA